MDILIENIELPRTVTIYPNGDIDELIDGKYVTIGKAIELPPHGRLGDLDANRQEFMDLVYNELYADGDNYRANRIIDAYDDIPTIVEASI